MTNGIARVGGEALEPRNAALLAHVLSRLRQSAGSEDGLATRFVRRHAATNVLVGLHCEMSFHLRAEIAVGAFVAPKERAEARQQSAHHFHNDTTQAERSEYGDRLHMACPYGGRSSEVSRGFWIVGLLIKKHHLKRRGCGERRGRQRMKILSFGFLCDPLRPPRFIIVSMVVRERPPSITTRSPWRSSSTEVISWYLAAFQSEARPIQRLARYQSPITRYLPCAQIARFHQ